MLSGRNSTPCFVRKGVRTQNRLMLLRLRQMETFEAILVTFFFYLFLKLIESHLHAYDFNIVNILGTLTYYNTGIKQEL